MKIPKKIRPAMGLELYTPARYDRRRDEEVLYEFLVNGFAQTSVSLGASPV
jgi:hypothetical protein